MRCLLRVVGNAVAVGRNRDGNRGRNRGLRARAAGRRGEVEGGGTDDRESKVGAVRDYNIVYETAAMGVQL